MSERRVRIECRDSAGHLLWSDSAVEIDGRVRFPPHDVRYDETVSVISVDDSTVQYVASDIQGDLSGWTATFSD